MRRILFLASMLASGYALAQTGNVGINTANPAATLEITPAAANAVTTATTNEGILIPRLSKDRVASIADAKLVKGTMIYVNDISSTITNPKVTNIIAEDYYYYDGTQWTRVGNDELNYIYMPTLKCDTSTGINEGQVWRTNDGVLTCTNKGFTYDGKVTLTGKMDRHMVATEKTSYVFYEYKPMSRDYSVVLKIRPDSVPTGWDMVTGEPSIYAQYLFRTNAILELRYGTDYFLWWTDTSSVYEQQPDYSEYFETATPNQYVFLNGTNEMGIDVSYIGIINIAWAKRVK